MYVRIKHEPDYGVGHTDGIVTYCCSATPCYLVEWPDGYSAYFEVSSCIPLN